MKRILVLLLIMALIASSHISVCALQNGLDDGTFSLVVDYSTADGMAVEGASLELYQIATLDEEFQITVTRDFSAFENEIKGEDTAWDVLAASLAAFIGEKNIPTADETLTDASGKGCFPTEGYKINPGIYLLLSPRYRYEGRICTPAPVLVTLPDQDSSGNLTVNMKFETTEDALLDIVVEKIWNDPGHEGERPEEVRVRLLRNGKAVENQDIILQDRNQWTGGWQNLDPMYDWTVEELRLENYEITYSKEKSDGVMHFTITNTYIPGPGEKLPQTGQHNWPIAWMALSGMILVMFGWRLCADGRKELDET